MNDSIMVDSLLANLDSDSLENDTSDTPSFEEFAAENPLYALLYPNVDQQTGQLREGPVVGVCAIRDTVKLNKILNDIEIQRMLPIDLKFSYTVKPFDEEGNFVQLIALRSDRDGKSSMEGDVITDASQVFGQFASSAEVSMSMNVEGAKQWKKINWRKYW